MKKKLENKTVLIAGGFSEIAKSCALAAIYEGAQVIIAGEVSDENKMAMEEINEESSDAVFIPCDISKFDEVQSTIKKIIKEFGVIDVALNNVGINCEINLETDSTKEAWLKVISANLNGVFNCMSLELPEMAKQKKGIVLNMATILGKQSFSASPHYIAVKHGIIGLTKTAALEYKTYGIRVNALCPGFIETSVITKNETFFKTEIKQHLAGFFAVKKIEKAEEIANGFIFMASERNPFITGTAVEIDEGYLSQ